VSCQQGEHPAAEESAAQEQLPEASTEVFSEEELLQVPEICSRLPVDLSRQFLMAASRIALNSNYNRALVQLMRSLVGF